MVPLPGASYELPGVTHTFPASISASTQSNSFVCKPNILADVRHTDVLRNVSFGDLLPFDPGSSCGVMLCNGTQTQQRNSGSLSTSVHKFVLSTIMKYNVFGCRGRGDKTKRHKSTNQRKCDNKISNSSYFFDK